MIGLAASAPSTELDAPTLRRALRGDAEASRALVELYQVRVLALTSRMLAGRGRATIEDAAQDTFLHVFRRLAAFDPNGPARLSTWILTIAARRAIDELRRQRPTLLPELDHAPEARAGERADERALRRELAAAIEAALHELARAGEQRAEIAKLRTRLAELEQRTGEHNQILQRIARERAGMLPPPADPAKTSPYERMMRAYMQLGHQAEAALARRLGPARAKEIRGDSWGSRSDWSGCPD